VVPDPDSIRIQGFDDQKLKKKIQRKFFFFFGSKIAIYLSLSQATGEALSPQKRTSSTSENEIN
jgi:hypothetical protein